MKMMRLFQFEKFTRGPLTAMAVSAMLLVGSVSSADAWHNSRKHGPGIIGGAAAGGLLGAAIGGKKGIVPGLIIGGAVGAATSSRAAPPPPPQPYYPPRPVQAGGLVYNIQISLSRLGYNPGPIDGAQAYDLMIAAARALTQSLNAELLDESGSTLSIQRECYLRDEIIQFQHSVLVA